MKTSAHKSWTARVEVVIPASVEVGVQYPHGASGYGKRVEHKLTITAVSTKRLQDAQNAVLNFVDLIQEEANS